MARVFFSRVEGRREKSARVREMALGGVRVGIRSPGQDVTACISYNAQGKGMDGRGMRAQWNG
jgi:hypothetical protein